MLRPLISHFLQTPAFQRLSANLKQTRYGRVSFLGHGACAETLHLCSAATQQRTGHCSNTAKMVNMLQCLRQERDYPTGGSMSPGVWKAVRCLIQGFQNHILFLELFQTTVLKHLGSLSSFCKILPQGCITHSLCVPCYNSQK